jgi:hypothetical protein
VRSQQRWAQRWALPDRGRAPAAGSPRCRPCWPYLLPGPSDAPGPAVVQPAAPFPCATPPALASLHLPRVQRPVLDLVDELLGVLDPEAQRKGFGAHGHPGGQQRVVGVARAVAHGHHHPARADLLAGGQPHARHLRPGVVWCGGLAGGAGEQGQRWGAVHCAGVPAAVAAVAVTSMWRAGSSRRRRGQAAVPPGSRLASPWAARVARSGPPTRRDGAGAA